MMKIDIKKTTTNKRKIKNGEIWVLLKKNVIDSDDDWFEEKTINKKSQKIKRNLISYARQSRLYDMMEMRKYKSSGMLRLESCL
jgi:hypothetical protein